jgi:ABC-type branched-subunit amino acid transport system permease subunit
MYSRPWVAVTVVLCAVFGVLAFPVFLRAKGPYVAVAYTLVGFAVIWFVYLARAWVFTRPPSQDGKSPQEGPGGDG